MPSIIKTGLSVLCLTTLTALVTPAAAIAAVFNFSYSFPTSDTVDFPSGFTAASGKFTAAPQGGGSYLVTKVTGLWNGQAITGVAALGAEGGNDNLIFPTQTPVLDSNGVTFSVAGPIAGDIGGGLVNIYNSSSGYTDLSNAAGYSSTFTLTAVPEPTTWALMLVGFAGLGGALRASRKAAAAPLTA